MSSNSGIIPLYGSPKNVIEKTKGCYVYDSDGKKYLDLESGVWVSILGHNNKKINSALKSSMSKAFHHGYGFKNLESEKLSYKLLKLLDFKNGECTFLSSGSEAVNLGLILARHITGRDKIVKISNSYLSAYGYGSLASDNQDKIDVKLNSLKSIEEINFSKVAAIVLEVGGASLDGVKFPKKKFIKALYEKGRSKNCIIIADEVTTGMGRTGKWFGFMHYDIEPDIVVAGKGLGNGYPISSVAINKKSAEKLAEKPLRYAQSHQNDPSGCKVANAVIKYISKNELIKKSQKNGEYFITKLVELKDNYRKDIIDIRGKGLMIGIELSSEQEAERVKLALLNKGFIVGNKGNSIRLLPPLVIKKKMIDDFIEALLSVL